MERIVIFISNWLLDSHGAFFLIIYMGVHDVYLYILTCYGLMCCGCHMDML